MTVEECAPRFIADLKIQNCSPHTIRAYESELRRFAASAKGVAVTDITVLHIRALIATLGGQGASPVTIRRTVGILRSFFKFARKAGFALTNPATSIMLPKKPSPLPEVPTVEQIEALIAGVKDVAMISVRPEVERDVLIFELLYGAGLRVSELVGLNLDDIDREERWLLIRGKGRKERQVPYGAKAHAALEAYLLKRRDGPGQNSLFVDPRYGLQRLSVRAVGNIVKQYSSAILGDSRIHPHTFRHAYATHLLNNGTDLRVLQTLLGHATITTTQRYTRVGIGRLCAVYDRSHPKG